MWMCPSRAISRSGKELVSILLVILNRFLLLPKQQAVTLKAVMKYIWYESKLKCCKNGSDDAEAIEPTRESETAIMVKFSAVSSKSVFFPENPRLILNSSSIIKRGGTLIITSAKFISHSRIVTSIFQDFFALPC